MATNTADPYNTHIAIIYVDCRDRDFSATFLHPVHASERSLGANYQAVTG